MERPAHLYDKHCPDWTEYIREIGSAQAMTRRDLSAIIGVPLTTFAKHEHNQGVFLRAQAELRAAYMLELHRFALADPMQAYPEDRAQVRALKADAAKHLTKLLERREELIDEHLQVDKTREVLERMTDEQLRAQAEKLLGR
jgi:RNase H-fold protein (predicted Holliday junction resolvase)